MYRLSQLAGLINRMSSTVITWRLHDILHSTRKAKDYSAHKRSSPRVAVVWIFLGQPTHEFKAFVVRLQTMLSHLKFTLPPEK